MRNTAIVLLLVGLASMIQPAAGRSRTPRIAKQRDGNPNGSWLQAHLQNLTDKEAMSRVDWVMFGDGQTAGWKTTGKEVMWRHFHRRNVLNLGVDEACRRACCSGSLPWQRERRALSIQCRMLLFSINDRWRWTFVVK